MMSCNFKHKYLKKLFKSIKNYCGNSVHEEVYSICRKDVKTWVF